MGQPKKREYRLQSAVTGSPKAVLHTIAMGASYFPAFAPLTVQLYFLENFSTRPALSTNFIVPVKNGWHCEQISTCSLAEVLRVLNSVPQLQ